MTDILVVNQYSIGTLNQVKRGYLKDGFSTFSLKKAKEHMTNPPRLSVMGKPYSPEVLGVYRLFYEVKDSSHLPDLRKTFYPDIYEGNNQLLPGEVREKLDSLSKNFIFASLTDVHPFLVQVGYNSSVSRGTVLRDILENDSGYLDKGRVNVLPFEKIVQDPDYVQTLHWMSLKYEHKNPMHMSVKDLGEILSTARDMGDLGSGFTRPDYETLIKAIARVDKKHN